MKDYNAIWNDLNTLLLYTSDLIEIIETDELREELYIFKHRLIDKKEELTDELNYIAMQGGKDYGNV